ncbi:4098_t:CDS:1, partial [Ambispora gerdemannii]
MFTLSFFSNFRKRGMNTSHLLLYQIKSTLSDGKIPLSINLFFNRAKHTDSKLKPSISFPLEQQSNTMFFPQPSNISGQDRKDPTAGRTFQVKGNAGIVYRRLWGVLTANQIRREVRENRYYEKPTVKRKRLARERHRKLFKEAVAKKVTLIMQMKQ